jgi:hypothetical protein
MSHRLRNHHKSLFIGRPIGHLNVSEGSFNANATLAAFKMCIRQDNENVDLAHLMLAYKEIAKLAAASFYYLFDLSNHLNNN